MSCYTQVLAAVLQYRPVRLFFFFVVFFLLLVAFLFFQHKSEGFLIPRCQSRRRWSHLAIGFNFDFNPRPPPRPVRLKKNVFRRELKASQPCWECWYRFSTWTCTLWCARSPTFGCSLSYWQDRVVLPNPGRYRLSPVDSLWYLRRKDQISDGPTPLPTGT